MATVYNLRGVKCPLPVLRAQKYLREVAIGDPIIIETDDPLAALDVPHFCQEKSHQLIASKELEDGAMRFEIERGQ